ncbi:MAG: hypothetical protein RML12_00280 [Xanthomonadales bacterium]|nr:hypothetical protein [Xanthomonadales bacterium]
MARGVGEVEHPGHEQDPGHHQRDHQHRHPHHAPLGFAAWWRRSMTAG